jgi:spore germination protein YaaH
MIKKLIMLFVFTFFATIGLFYLRDYFISQQQTGVVQKENMTLKDAEITGWTAYWDEEQTISALPLAMPALSTFSPILYQISQESTLEEISVERKTDLLGLAGNNNVPVIPVISDNSDRDAFLELLNDSGKADAFRNVLVSVAKDNNYQGWSIDIELLQEDDKQSYSDFITETGNHLHSNDLKFNVIVYARTENDTNPGALAQDYEAIGKAADEVHLMVYGYANEGTPPGGQAPPAFIDETITYTLERIPREKIVIGLSTHGYDWEEKPQNLSRTLKSKNELKRRMHQSILMKKHLLQLRSIWKIAQTMSYGLKTTKASR